MIRFVLGVLMLLIGASTMETSTSVINHGFVICLAGLGLMYWAVPTLQKKYDE